MNSDFVECAECNVLKPFIFYNIIKRKDENDKEVQTLINTCYECEINDIVATANKPEYLIDGDFKNLQNVLLATHYNYINEVQILLNVLKKIHEEERLISTKLGLLPFSIAKVQLFFQSKEKEKLIHQTEEYLNSLKGQVANDIMNVITRSLYKIEKFEDRLKECLTCERSGDSVQVCDSCKEVYKQGLAL
jgi:hypothetical protein